MDLGLNGTKALVTGGPRGVGRGVVLALARAGMDVITCYRQESELAASLERELKKLGDNHHVLRADISDPAQLEGLFEEIRVRFGALDLVVNNAAAISHVPYQELSLQEWRRVVDTNLTSVFLTIQHALPLLSSRGSVICIGSKSTEVGIPLRAHYTATKAGLRGLSRSLAKEFGKRGLRFNVLALGMIETEAWSDLPAAQAQAMHDRYEGMTALGRLGTPDDVAGAVLWLASDLSRYVTGATIHVDGGIS